MAVTVVKQVTQRGKRFWLTAVCTSGAASAATATLLDFSGDLNATPNIDKLIATAVKIRRIISTGHNASTSNGLWALYFDATTDQFFAELPSKSAVANIDLSSFPDRGFVDPKATGFTGDILIKLSSPNLTNDVVSVIMEGELIP